MTVPLRCLIVEDSADDARLVLRSLRDGGYDVTSERVDKPEAMRAALERQPWDLVISDYNMPHFNGLAALEMVKASGLDLPFIMVSGAIGEEQAVEAMRAGAHDYLMKGKLARLVPAVQRELRDAVERREHQRAEATLRLNTTALTAAANGIVITDRAGAIVWVNPAFTTLTGYTLADATGRNPRDLVKSDQHPRAFYQQMWETVLAGRVWHGELVNRRKDGSLYPEDMTITPMRDAAGEITNFIAIKQDLTERKRADEALHASTRKFQAVFEQAAVGMIIAEGSRGHFVNANRRFCEMVGYSAGELEQLSSHDLTHPDDIAADTDQLEQISFGVIREFTREKRYRRKDGTFVWAKVFVAPLDPSEARPTLRIGVIEDITERRQAEEARDHSLSLTRATLESTADGILVVDTAGKIETFNQNFAKMWRLPAELLASEDDNRVISSVLEQLNEPEKFLEKVRHLYNHPPEKSFDTLDFKDGRVFERYSRPQLIGGQVAGRVWSFRDVTAHKRAERQSVGELRVLELLARAASLPEVLDGLAREYEGLCTGMKCSVLLLDADGRHLRHGVAPSLPADYNAAIDGIEIGPCAGSCGTAAHTGRAVIVSDIATDPLWAAFKELAQTHGLRACWSVPILGEAGRVLGTLALYYHEVRAPQPEELATHERAAQLASLAILQHHAREALRNSEERYRLLFENNPLPMWVYELETLRFLAVNESAVQHYGYSREEFLGMTIKQIRLEEDIPALLKSVEGGRAETLGTSEWRHRRKDGSIIHVEIISRPLVFEGHDARLVLAADITEKKLLKEKFLHAQRLESLGMLAAGIAHDLNNVLAPILFIGPMLRASLSTARDLKILDTLEQSAARGAGLVKQILSFVHSTTGDFRPTQVKHLAWDIVSLIEETFPKSIELHHDIPSDLWPVLGNPTQIHQILMNLCVNARDAMPQGGTLSITAANRRLDAAEAGTLEGGRAGDWLVLKVTDTGSGIAPELMENIWTPFFTTKGVGKGTGLGLTTIRSIVTSHQGFITLDTAVGRGSSFRVFLPAAENGTAEKNSAAPFADHAGHNELILVVDDDPSIQNLVAAILGKFGYRVMKCSDGLEAIALFKARTGEIALVITDADMPRLGGLALAQALLEVRPDIRIISMSGMSHQGVASPDIPSLRGLTHGFLQKPFKIEELLAAVHQQLHAARKDVPA